MRSTPPEALPSLVFTARRDDFQIAPSVRRCEELARQAKPPAPPSLQTLGQQARWGRRFRLPGRPEAIFYSFSAQRRVIWTVRGLVFITLLCVAAHMLSRMLNGSRDEIAIR